MFLWKSNHRTRPQKIAKSLNGLTSTTAGFANLAGGNIPTAINLFKNAFASLRSVLSISPLTAIAGALGSIVYYVGATAWKKYEEGIKAASNAIEELIEKRRRLLELDSVSEVPVPAIHSEIGTTQNLSPKSLLDRIFFRWIKRELELPAVNPIRGRIRTMVAAEGFEPPTKGL